MPDLPLRHTPSRRFVSFLFALAIALPIAVASAHEDGPKIDGAWSRATLPGTTLGAAYMTITTHSPDRLLGAASAVAEKVELHTHLMEGGVMKMREVPVIDLRPDAVTELKPGGFHIMLIGVKQPLAAGETFPLTLTFEKAGTREVKVAVRAANTVAPAAPGGHGHGAPAPKPGS